MKNKITFTNKPSIVGKNKQMLIYIPVVIKKLINPEKEYKITLEELPEDVLVPTEINIRENTKGGE